MMTAIAPAAPFDVAVVFIDMMDSDDARSAREAAARLAHPRMRFFHDPQRRVGLLLARSLGWTHHVAWDTYCFYAVGLVGEGQWEGPTPPPPSEWFHALQDREVWAEQAAAAGEPSEWTEQLAERSEADPARFRAGEALDTALRDAMLRLTARR